jgi:hypothetical protein
MDLARVLALYDAQVRGRPRATGAAVEHECDVLRLTGPFNFICCWNPATVDAAVAQQAAHFRTKGESLMWRVYDRDGPDHLPALLAAEGFVAEPPGTLMLFDLTQAFPAPPAEVEVTRVRDLFDLDAFVAASDAAFGDAVASERRAAYEKGLADPDLLLFVARIEGAPIASARLETSPDWDFGLMFGGGTMPTHRGYGAYRALVAARVAAARAAGLKYLSTEARDTSRPILERLGFTPAGRETTWVLPA